MSTGPVFVLGPERSGANLLAWSLGQHPALKAALSTGWLGSLPADLDRVFEVAAVDAQLHGLGVTRADLHRAFGEATLGLLTGSPGDGPRPRLVDATPQHAFNVFALRWLYPDARFIHMVRDVSAVVRLLLDKDVSKLFRTYHRETKAHEHWLSTVRACLRAEQALGSERVLRVRHHDLATGPEQVLRRCLDFVGEDWNPACMRPLDGVSADVETGASGETAAGPFKDEAEALSRFLLSAAPPSYPPDPALIQEHERASMQLARRASVPTDVGALVVQVRDTMEAVIPAQSRALVVSRGDDRLLELSDRTAGHFPQCQDGLYLGHHPADGAEAIAHLEELRDRGAQFLVIPSTAFWWLDHYGDFRRHLDRYRVVAHRPDVCIVYSLDTGAHAGLDLEELVPDGADERASLGSLSSRLEELEAELPVLRSRLATALAGAGSDARTAP